MWATMGQGQGPRRGKLGVLSAQWVPTTLSVALQRSQAVCHVRLGRQAVARELSSLDPAKCADQGGLHPRREHQPVYHAPSHITHQIQLRVCPVLHGASCPSRGMRARRRASQDSAHRLHTQNACLVGPESMQTQTGPQSAHLALLGLRSRARGAPCLAHRVPLESIKAEAGRSHASIAQRVAQPWPLALCSHGSACAETAPWRQYHRL